MGHTANSVLINASYDKVFDVSNDIERWTELFDEYKEAKIIKREGNKITFRLANKEGNAWQSWRVLDKVNHFCVAKREEPKFPFVYMRLTWLYEELPEGTLMTWIQDFKMDSKAKFNDEQAQELIQKHSQVNMERMKQFIEKEAEK